MLEINKLAPLNELENMSRRERKKQETRWRIYRAAMQLFTRQGFDEVKIEAICERADVSNASFFHHFSGKAALIGAYWDELKEKIRAALEDAGNTNSTEKLAIISAEVTRSARHTAAFTPQLFSAIASGDKTIDMEHIDTGITGTLTGIIREGQEAGEFSKSWHPEVVAVNLAATWILLPLAMRSADFPAEPHREILNMTLAGLGADPARR